ncbi:MAG TPA: nucleotidyl transferase AbiEii/AbiGii toxin family protein [Longimicrobium sp.]
MLSADPRVVRPLHLQIMRVVAETEAAYGDVGLRLEGGTALAAYHLRHRESEDLDFFGDPRMDARDFGAALRERLMSEGFELRPAGPATQGFARFIVDPDPGSESDPVRLDLARSSPFRLEQLELSQEGVKVASFRDLCAGKMHAICDRFEPRDFIDLDAILRHPDGGTNPELAQRRAGALIDDVLRIDPGLTPAFVGQALERGTRTPIVSMFPLRLLRPVREEAVQSTLQVAIDECARRVSGRVTGQG